MEIEPTEPVQPQPIEIKQDLISELIAYIEAVEQRIENEWGWTRPISEVIEKNEMPEVHYKLKEMRELPPNHND